MTTDITATDSLLMVLDNDRTAYDFCYSTAENYYETDNTGLYQAADEIKDMVETWCDDAGAGLTEPASLIVAQLFGHALDDVDWHEVARHYFRKIEENRAS